MALLALAAAVCTYDADVTGWLDAGVTWAAFWLVGVLCVLLAATALIALRAAGRAMAGVAPGEQPDLEVTFAEAAILGAVALLVWAAYG